MSTDLFGEPLRPPAPEKRRGTGAQGYASLPGLGPKGETCGSCEHRAHFRRWSKCRLVRTRWTGGIKTDIEARSPACKFWEAIQQTEQRKGRPS